MYKFYFGILLVISSLQLSAQTYSNGLTATGSGGSASVKLGGTLTGNTSIDLGASYTFSLIKSTAPSYLTVLNNGNVGIGVTSPATKLDLSGKSTFTDASAANNAASFNFITPANTITASFGSDVSASSLTTNQWSGALRFRGQDVAWGDFAFYPNGGGSGNAGHFRFSTTGNILSTTPSGKLGVGELYSVGNVGIGTTSPITPLQVNGDASISGNFGVNTTAPSVPVQVNVKAGASALSQINVAGLDYTYSAGRGYGTDPIPSVIGIDQANGISYINDGSVINTAFVSNQKILWNGYATSTYRSFKVAGPEQNLGNYTLEIVNRSAAFAVDPNHYWVSQAFSNNIISYNKPLNIGTWGYGGVKLFGNGYLIANKTADLYVSDNGSIGINTEAPSEKLHVAGNVYTSGKILVNHANNSAVTDYMLAVNGSAIFTRAVVRPIAEWPDYVFASDYNLRPLTEVEAFLKKYRHLPEMPSSEEVNEQGIDLGNNQELMLRKIEELTLYVIELDKKSSAITEENKLFCERMQLLSKENELLQKKLAQLEKELEKK